MAIGATRNPPNVVHKRIVPAGSSPPPLCARRGKAQPSSLLADIAVCRGGNRSESFAQHYPRRSGLLAQAFRHETVLRGTLERLAVRADRLGRARLALALRHEAVLRCARQLLSSFTDRLAFACPRCGRSLRRRRAECHAERES